MNAIGARVYGLAAMIMGAAGLLWDDFATGWIPAPAALPGRATLAYVVGMLLVAGGVAINIRRTAAWGAALLTAVFALGFLLLDLTRLATHLSHFDYWESSAEQLALVAGGVIAFASVAKMETRSSTRIISSGRLAFGGCLLVFGAAHFVYADYTATLVPKWLPPGTLFWTYATGIAAIAAGLAILSNVLALLAARLLTAMYLIFGILVHARLLLAAPLSHANWIENAINLALMGAAWIVADSFAGEPVRAWFGRGVTHGPGAS
jgi:uncharacterized membrane protein